MFEFSASVVSVSPPSVDPKSQQDATNDHDSFHHDPSPGSYDVRSDHIALLRSCEAFWKYFQHRCDERRGRRIRKGTVMRARLRAPPNNAISRQTPAWRGAGSARNSGDVSGFPFLEWSRRSRASRTC
jgi:hypothetical protein